MQSIDRKRAELLALIRSWQSVAVAFSAGVDSTVVAKAAQIALADQAVAVTATSASLADGELEQARELARQIGIRHLVVATDEFENPDYTRNATDRCFHCKTELYSQMVPVAERLGAKVIVNGANLDDSADYRPGHLAAGNFQVQSPLADCGFNKAEVRQLAAHWKLPIWDKPATPCLSSRVAYGEEVTPERLKMIDQAERFLSENGLRGHRVRYHRGELARLEVPLDWLPAMCEVEFRERVIEKLRELGFKYITLDLEGFRSGSLNAMVPVEMLRLADDDQAD